MIPIKVVWSTFPVTVPGIRRSDYQKEIAFQVWCADYLRKRFAVTGDRRYSHWHHSANEREGARAGLLCKLMGQSKGFPDLINLELRLAIELKVPCGKASKEQELWGEYLKAIGWQWHVIRTTAEFIRVLDDSI